MCKQPSSKQQRRLHLSDLLPLCEAPDNTCARVLLQQTLHYRHCHLTVIGDESEVDEFTESIRGCFLTEEEIVRWRAGETFPDPWPANYVTRSR